MTRRNQHIEHLLERKTRWTFEEVKEFADFHNVRVRSVIQKLEYLQIQYVKKPREKAKKQGRDQITREQAVKEVVKKLKLKPATGLELMKVRKDGLFDVIDGIDKLTKKKS